MHVGCTRSDESCTAVLKHETGSRFAIQTLGAQQPRLRVGLVQREVVGTDTCDMSKIDRMNAERTVRFRDDIFEFELLYEAINDPHRAARDDRNLEVLGRLAERSGGARNRPKIELKESLELN